MAKRERNRIVRPDGKQIYLVPKKGHLIVCARGCCCGRTDRGNPPVPIDFYKQEYARRKIRKHVQLTMSGCIGPCPMLNVVQLVFDGRPIWFQAINRTEQVQAIFDYLDTLLAADGFLPPPPTLAEYVFDYYRWNHTNEVSGLPPALAADQGGLRLDGMLLLTHADTDLQCLAAACRELPEEFPAVRGMSLNPVRCEQQLKTLYALHGRSAQVIVVRHLGGLDATPGLRWLATQAKHHGQHLLALSGTTNPDPELTAVSTVSPAVVHELAAYLQAGGFVNFGQAIRFLADHLLRTGFGYEAPGELPSHGIYHPRQAGADSRTAAPCSFPGQPTIGIIFYRAHWSSGNLAFVDAMIDQIERQGMNALAIFTNSLKDLSGCSSAPQDGWPAALDYVIDPASGRPRVDALILSISFALGSSSRQAAGQVAASTTPLPSPLETLGVPVLQAIHCGGPRWQWESSSRGLGPLDTAMNVAIPELDGRIITVPVSFKEKFGGDEAATVETLHYQQDEERIERLIGIAARLTKLRRIPNSQKRVAFMLTNSSGKAASVGNAVGLDSPASLIQVFQAMRAAGYQIDDLPADGDALIHALLDRCSYDEIYLTEEQLARAHGVPVKQYQQWFDELPETQQQQMTKQWGPPPGEAYVHDGAIRLAGIQLGNAFLALQPPRGYGMDPDAIYHQPDLPPPHNYYALYRWLRDVWGADAIVHMGKHGTLEWLPGKGVGMSGQCFPDTLLADLPLVYPFIINDPGEGTQAKRRGHAVIIDHLTPPMTQADAYGPLAELTQLVDEYYQVELTDPSKLPILQQQIWQLIRESHLDEDLQRLLTDPNHGHTHEWDEGTNEDGTPLSLATMRGTEIAHVIEELDAYLCELTGAQIRDGLHTLGAIPDGEQLVGLLAAMLRLPNLDCPSLPASLAAALGLSLETLLDDRGGRLAAPPEQLQRLVDAPLVTCSDALEAIDTLAHRLLQGMQHRRFDPAQIDQVLAQVLENPLLDGTRQLRCVLDFACRQAHPALLGTEAEISHLLAALDGQHIPAGPSGAPSRGMVHILPTGRNFYAVDPRAVPSQAAWKVGQDLANAVLQRHLNECGSYPETVGISVWGTSNMRTQGDDVAEVLALLGVRPQWRQENRRVIGIEVIPLEELRRPRIDVVIRISGFFRDAFPHLIRLLDEAVELVAQLDEPPDQNFVRNHYLQEVDSAVEQGQCQFDADRRARYRIFGAKPGSYGAGILPLIDQRNWQQDADFAEAYVNWGGYAYAADEQGVDARDVFRQRLSSVQVALHNQDNREHDIFDSDDYLQFHGGMIATIRSLAGQQPRHYFGDTQDPSRPAVRDLKEEALRVFRTRVINPKWINSIRRHGYKGALELSATVDYLFGYDATAGVVDDWMYEQVARDYALAPEMQAFFQQSNPWALHSIAERLLEASQRGLWAEPDPDTIAKLQQTLLQAESMLEGRGDRESIVPAAPGASS